MLQPSGRDAIRSYEEAQDDVGAWFAAADICLTRGETRKKKVRDAIRHNEKLREEQQKGHRLDEVEQALPEYRQHVSPRKWREAQECKLVEREADVQAREGRMVESEAAVVEREQVASDKQREAEEVLTVAQSVADGDLSLAGGTQAQDNPDEPAPSKPTLAKRLFGRAGARLRQDERAAARAELQDAFDEVRLTEETNPQNTQTPPKTDQTQPEKPRRRKKTPPIDFSALEERDYKLLQNIATTGARVAGRQQKVCESQLTAMKDTLPDVLPEAAETAPPFLRQWFDMMLTTATPANARKIASHPLCPPALADACRRHA